MLTMTNLGEAMVEYATAGISALLIGFVTGLTLIVAIGPQNAFVLRQGIRRASTCSQLWRCARHRTWR